MAERVIAGLTRLVIGRGVAPLAGSEPSPAMAVLFQPSVSGVAAQVAAAGRAAGARIVERPLPDGEAAKTLRVVEGTARWLAEAGIRRDDAIVAVGGGALTDVVGFVAAVYLRGIEARYVPTTLLGAVDAAVGGKTGVDVGGKNLVGAFRHPALVVVDLDVVGSIGRDLMAEGMSEAIKAGVVGDVALFEEIERHGLDADLEQVVIRSIDVKAGVVERDFEETGIRAHLNFGHTVGHAVEAASGWRHGPSVAVGMMAAAAASQIVLGFGDGHRIRASLERVGLPISAPPGLDRAEVERLMTMDKKADAAGVRMVLLEGLERPMVSHVDSATLDAALSSVGIGDK